MGRLDYLKQYGAKNTVITYKAALKSFFEMVYGEREPLEQLAERYFQEKRDHQADVQKFLVELKGLAPKSIRLKVSAIRTFLLENNVELPQRFWRRLTGRIKGKHALTLDKVPNNIELRKILTHIPVQGKALYLTLASSGMCIGEALQLTLEDIELDRDPAKVNIRGEYTKSGNPRVAFISREARESIEEWFKIRGEYLNAAARKSHKYGKSVDDPRVFPFEITTAYVMWRNALRKARFKTRDERTNRHRVHPHVLRKFFRTKLASVIPVDVVEALMGHEGYLTEVYRRYSHEDLARFYNQGEHALLIFTEAAEVSRLKQEVEERNRQLQTLVNGLTAENLELKSRMSKVELENTDLKRRFQLTEQKLAELDRLIREVLEQHEA